MGKGGGGSEGTVRYAPYLEDAHQQLINEGWTYVNALTGESPFTGFSVVKPSDAFFGLGYVISSFPSVYDMFGKFQAGLDVEVLYRQVYDDMVNDPVTLGMITSEAQYIEDDINQVSIPKITTGFRDMNAVMSSSFIFAKTQMEMNKDKAINKFAAEIKMKAMELALQRWTKHLEWNNNVISQYLKINQLFFQSNNEYLNAYYSLAQQNAMWPLTVLDHERAIIGALNGAAASAKGKEGGGGTAQVISSVIAVAGMAAMMMSSRRFKHMIETIGMLRGIRFVRYYYKWSNRLHIGVVAEELERTHPQHLLYDYKGDPIAVNYSSLLTEIGGA